MSHPTTADKRQADVPVRPAEIVREYGPFAGSSKVGGVSHDGHNVWAALARRWSPSTRRAARPHAP